MISFDTNILFPAVVQADSHHPKAAGFLRMLEDREDVIISEFSLVELYNLLRNPAVITKPLSAPEAAAVCQHFRSHPRWRIAGFGTEGRILHDTLWKKAGEISFPRRRIYDLRMALTLVQQGVAEFATVNLKDFENAGFLKVWNPLSTK